MKCHVGVDVGTGYVHTITAASANIHDITEIHKPPCKNGIVVYGDSGYIDHRKSPVRSKVEHIFHYIKVKFGFTKVCYRGIAKNSHKPNVAFFACANLLMYDYAKKHSVPSKG